jgi:hypothetical protein
LDQARSYLTCHTNCKIEIVIDDQERLPVIPQVDDILLSQANETKYINNVGLTCELSKVLGFSSWQDILENKAGSHNVPFQSFPETEPNNTGINSTSQGYETMGQHLTISITKQYDNRSFIPAEAEGNWQVWD